MDAISKVGSVNQIATVVTLSMRNRIDPGSEMPDNNPVLTALLQASSQCSCFSK